jgi:Tol biopolymer transport system component
MRTFLLAVAIVAAASAIGAPALEAATPRLAFSVNRNGWSEIWTMRADGTHRRRLTPLARPGTDASGNRSPAWSPDGRWLAFVGTGRARQEDQRDQELWVMRADGSAHRPLTRDRVADHDPTWSRDGRRILFSRTIGRGSRSSMAIYSIRRDGGAVTRVTAPGPRTFDLGPDASPTDGRIAFGRARATKRGYGTYVMSPRGRPRLVLPLGFGPAWSPDGARLAFVSARDANGQTCFHECSISGEIYVAAADGSQPARLTRTEADESSPAWSPDGTKIAFSSDRRDPDEHAVDLYVMNADGSCPTRITGGRHWEGEPEWQPALGPSGPRLAC